MTDGHYRTLRDKQEEELLLLSELSRRSATDPLKVFDPHLKQKAFIDAVLNGPKDENHLIAANRSGKSDAGAFAGATLARFGDQSNDVKFIRGANSAISIRDRATSGWVSALDFPTSRDVIQPKYFNNGFVPAGATHEPFIPEREIADWRVGDQVLKLKNGSIIGFKSAETGRTKYQGAEKDWVHMDEEHPKDIYDEISIRIGARKLRKFITATLLPPPGQLGGVSWMFESIIKPWLAGTNPNVEIFQSSIYDNPYIPIPEIAKLEALWPEGSIDRRIRLNGELLPGLAGSRAYMAFNTSINTRPQPDIVFRRPLAWIWDFNVEPMVSLIGQRERLKNNKTLFRIYKELIIDGGASVSEMCDLFKQYHPRHQSEIWIYGDSTSRNRNRQTGKSDYTLILNEMVRYGVPIKLKVPDSNPSQPDRINSVNNVCSDIDKECRLEVDPGCTELIADLEGVLKDARGGIKKTYNSKDPYFRRTHTSDALGYWVHFEEPVRFIRGEDITRKVKIKQPSYGFTTAQRL